MKPYIKNIGLQASSFDPGFVEIKGEDGSDLSVTNKGYIEFPDGTKYVLTSNQKIKLTGEIVLVWPEDFNES